jgi:hypothetical protein
LIARDALPKVQKYTKDYFTYNIVSSLHLEKKRFLRRKKPGRFFFLYGKHDLSQWASIKVIDFLIQHRCANQLSQSCFRFLSEILFQTRTGKTNTITKFISCHVGGVKSSEQFLRNLNVNLNLKLNLNLHLNEWKILVHHDKCQKKESELKIRQKMQMSKNEKLKLENWKVYIIASTFVKQTLDK